MRNLSKVYFAIAITFVVCFAAPANAVWLVGSANSVNPVTASGTLNGVSWTATTTSSASFLGINMGSGLWDLSTPLDPGSLFLGTGNVNAGDTQTFAFSQPISDIFFYVENFDSSSAANVISDGVLSIINSTSGVSFSPTTASSAILANANSSFDGVGNVILKFSGPTSYVQFDYTAGEQANGIFYGFAIEETLTPTAVPEPSSFLMLLMMASGVSYIRRNRVV